MTIQAPIQEKSTLDIQSLSAILNSDGESLAKRFRALFHLKTLNNAESIAAIASAFEDDSALLKHEVAYVLGQMKNPLALTFLQGVLSDLKQEAMVRHEAAEAIGAIGNLDSIPFLTRFANDEERVVRDTVQLAIAGLQYNASNVNPDERYIDNPTDTGNFRRSILHHLRKRNSRRDS